MKKQEKQEHVINLDTFEEVSLWQMIPSGKGMGQSLLKTLVDSVHNGNAKLKSLLITGKEGLRTHASAFIRALGIDNYNQIDGSMLHPASGLVQFFNTDKYQAYMITNAEKITPVVQLPICHILTKQQFSLYNFMKEGSDVFDVPGVIVMTTTNISKVADPILDCFDHIVEIEDYTTGQLELIILQRLKYAHIEYENEYVLNNIVRYGNHNLNQSIRFMKCCIAVMQAEGRQMLTPDDVIKAARLNRLPALAVGDDIPF